MSLVHIRLLSSKEMELFRPSTAPSPSAIIRYHHQTRSFNFEHKAFKGCGNPGTPFSWLEKKLLFDKRICLLRKISGNSPICPDPAVSLLHHWLVRCPVNGRRWQAGITQWVIWTRWGKSDFTGRINLLPIKVLPLLRGLVDTFLIQIVTNRSNSQLAEHGKMSPGVINRGNYCHHKAHTISW